MKHETDSFVSIIDTISGPWTKGDPLLRSSPSRAAELMTAPPTGGEFDVDVPLKTLAPFLRPDAPVR